jgi:hypothetical protein
MKRTPVQSSNVVSIGYEDGVLEVEFKSGVYQYAGVPQETFDALMAAESKGQFVSRHIRDAFPFTKMEVAA